MKRLVDLPLLMHIEILRRSRSRSFKNWGVGVGSFVYRHHSPGENCISFQTALSIAGRPVRTGYLLALSPYLITVEPEAVDAMCPWVVGTCRDYSVSQNVRPFTVTETWKLVTTSVCLHSIALMSWNCPVIYECGYSRSCRGWNISPSRLDGLRVPYSGCIAGAHPMGGAGLQPSKPQNRNLKNANFVDAVISKVLCDLPFSRNQPLKSADN
jgi:hypothetical protein